MSGASFDQKRKANRGKCERVSPLARILTCSANSVAELGVAGGSMHRPPRRPSTGVVLRVSIRVRSLNTLRSFTKKSSLPRRRFLSRLPFYVAVVGTLAAAAAYIFGMAVFQSTQHRYYTPGDLIIPRLIDVVVLAWCFWIGSSIGSFLNVVAWRMPRGEGVGGRSHCPRCLSQLRARDNFPVFGWLALGGRCHSCRLPISVRYPIVEAAVGSSLSLVAIGQLYRFSLPSQLIHWHGGPLWAPRIDASVLGVLAFHVFAVSLSWAMGLVRLDGHRLPGRLVRVGLGVTVVAMLAYPPVAVVSWQMNSASVDDLVGIGRYADAGVRVLTALAAAALLGRSLAKAFCPAADPKMDPLGKSTTRLIDLIAIVCVPALLVGWQTVPAVAVVATLAAVPIKRWVRVPTDSFGTFAIAVPIVLSVQLFAWQWLSGLAWWPGSPIGSAESSPWTILAWATAVLVVPLWLKDHSPAPIATPEDFAHDEEEDEDEDQR